MNNEIIKPSPSERKLAREFCELLAEIQTPIHFTDADRMAIRLDYHTQMLVLPMRFFEQFVSMMKCLATGGTVCVFQFEEMVTTQKAAEILNISRPHLVKLLEKGEIPFVLVSILSVILIRSMPFLSKSITILINSCSDLPNLSNFQIMILSPVFTTFSNVSNSL